MAQTFLTALTEFTDLFLPSLTKNQPIRDYPKVDKNEAWFATFIATALLCFAVTWIARLSVINPLVRRVTFFKSRVKSKSKFAQAVTELFTYSIFFYFGCAVLLPTDWLFDPSQWFEGLKSSSTPSANSNNLRFYYLLYAGRYLSTLISVLVEKKRKVSFIILRRVEAPCKIATHVYLTSTTELTYSTFLPRSLHWRLL